MKRNLFALLAALLLLTACQAIPVAESQAPKTSSATQKEGPTMAGEYHKITAEEAKTKMDTETVTIVDVRTMEEYQEGHVSGAILVPNESISNEMPESLPDQEAVLLVYCRSGRRSKEAAEKLLAIGYQNVYDFGGIIDWPYDIVKE